jgi:hypothetical protein
MTSQWIAFAAIVLAMVGLVYAFVRKGSGIKPDPENKGRSDQGYF